VAARSEKPERYEQAGKAIFLNDRPLACACGSLDLMSVEPGGDDEVLLGMAVTRGRKARGWCAACWIRKFDASKQVGEE